MNINDCRFTRLSDGKVTLLTPAGDRHEAVRLVMVRYPQRARLLADIASQVGSLLPVRPPASFRHRPGRGPRRGLPARQTRPSSKSTLGGMIA